MLPVVAAESLPLSTKFDSLELLRATIMEAERSEQPVDQEVLATARARLAALATAELERAVLKRQLNPLRDAFATAEGEGDGVVDAGVLERATTLLSVLEAEAPGAELAPVGTHGVDTLSYPTHIDSEVVFGPFLHCAGKTTTAKHGYEYWGGADEPWRNGMDKVRSVA